MMIHRPLYRWKSAWLGVLVLAFIGWAWVRSMAHLDILVWNSSAKTQAVFLRSQASEVLVQVTGSGSALAHLRPGFSRVSFPYKKSRDWFPRAATSMPFDGSGGRNISVAYWVIMLASFFLWSGFLVWHGWRTRRRARNAGLISPEGSE
jgi:hypothetical protein